MLHRERAARPDGRADRRRAHAVGRSGRARRASRPSASLHVDVLFLGVHGVSADAGFTTPNLLEAETDRALVAAAERVVVVADHTKWGVRGLSQIAGSSRRRLRLRSWSDADARGVLAEHVDSSSLHPAPLSPRRTARPEPSSRDVQAPEVEARTPAPRSRSDLRTDGVTGARTFIVDSRQTRPNLPEADVPVLPRRARGAGDLRRPLVPEPLAGDAGRPVRGRALHPRPRRDVLVARRRTARAGSSTSGPSAPPRLGARPDVDYVLVFENRGAEVGATITHPHGQIYAFEFVPEAPLRELEQARRSTSPATGSSRERRLARVGSRGARLSVRPAARARRPGARPAVAQRRRSPRPGEISNTYAARRNSSTSRLSTAWKKAGA